jgi:hypothetical protein
MKEEDTVAFAELIENWFSISCQGKPVLRVFTTCVSYNSLTQHEFHDNRPRELEKNRPENK